MSAPEGDVAAAVQSLGEFVEHMTGIDDPHGTSLARIHARAALALLTAALAAATTRAELQEQSADSLRARADKLEKNADFLRESIGECHMMLSRLGDGVAYHVRQDWDATTLPARLRVYLSQLAGATQRAEAAQEEADEYGTLLVKISHAMGHAATGIVFRWAGKDLPEHIADLRQRAEAAERTAGNRDEEREWLLNHALLYELGDEGESYTAAQVAEILRLLADSLPLRVARGHAADAVRAAISDDGQSVQRVEPAALAGALMADAVELREKLAAAERTAAIGHALLSQIHAALGLAPAVSLSAGHVRAVVDECARLRAGA